MRVRLWITTIIILTLAASVPGMGNGNVPRATPKPQAAIAATHTRTPVPADTPISTATLQSVDVPTATATATHTPTRTPSPTPVATATRRPTRTPSPMPVATFTPASTSTPWPLLQAPGARGVTVCASGCDFASIQAAIDDPGTLPGDTIHVADAIHTEAGLAGAKMPYEAFDSRMPIYGFKKLREMVSLSRLAEVARTLTKPDDDRFYIEGLDRAEAMEAIKVAKRFVDAADRLVQPTPELAQTPVLNRDGMLRKKYGGMIGSRMPRPRI